MNKIFEQLLKDLDDNDPHIRFAAARTVGELGEKGDEIKSALFGALKDSHWFVRLSVLQTIRELKFNEDEILEYITPLLKDVHEDVREYAVLTIGDFNEKAAPAANALAEVLFDPVWYVRATTAKILGKIGKGARNSIDRLKKCMCNDNEVDVCISAARSLAKICCCEDLEVISSLEKIKIDPKKPIELQNIAEESLQKITNQKL